MKDSNKLLIDVLDYIVQFEKLNRKPVYSLQSDIFEAYQSQLMGLPGVEFNLQIDNDDIWLKITRLKETLSPEPSEYLKPWITVSKSPDVLPILKNEIAVYENDTDIKIEKLGDYPEIQSEFDFYFSSHWKPWSVQESPKRKTIGYYNKLFTVQQEISSHSVDSPIELVWGVGFSLWSLPEKEKVVKYPLITQSCEIYLNQTTFDIEIRPRDSEPKLEIDCYEALENRGVRSLIEFWKNINENSITRVNPFEASTYEVFLNAAVLYLDSNGLYLSNQPESVLPIPTDNLTITDTWVLFVRKRSEHIFIDDIERLKNRISTDIEIPIAIEGFVQVGESTIKSRETIKFRGLSYSDIPSQGVKELYFPMPYNDEQVSIIEKLEFSDGVVVQGPPGTGKTHTIANVICHFLAQGKRVLVTAAGESALTVLQDKLPEKIRPLSVALTTDERDGKKQFEFSIQKIASTINSLNPNQTLTNIELLETRLDELHAKISAIDQNINSFAEKNMKYYSFQGKDILLAELAKFVLEHQVDYGWLEDAISSKCTPKFSNDDIKALRNARSIVANDIFNIDNSFPICDDFPSWHILAGLHSDLIHAEEFRDKVSVGEVLPLVNVKPETLFEARNLLGSVDIST